MLCLAWPNTPLRLITKQPGNDEMPSARIAAHWLICSAALSSMEGC